MKAAIIAICNLINRFNKQITPFIERASTMLNINQVRALKLI